MPERPPTHLARDTRFRGVGVAVLILLFGLLGTWWLATYFRSSSEQEARREFDVVCNEIRGKIAERLQAHEQVLRSGAAFLEHVGGINRDDWRRFTQRQQFDQYLPGIQGVGFSLLIPRERLAEHISEMRAQGFADYRVTPEGDRDPYSSIVYLEPFDPRNRRAFGYDMFSEPVRRMAMERARDENAAALTGKVILVQETDEDVQAGTLMYLPIYRQDMSLATVEERRAALVGWVYSPYRMRDLMRGILGDWERARDQRLRLEVFDGDGAAPESLLYDSGAEGAAAVQAADGLVVQRPILSAGRQWTLRFLRTGERFALFDDLRARIVLPAGSIVSLLLAGLFFSLQNTRVKAMRLAGELTAELQTAHDKLEQRVLERTRQLQQANERREAILESISDAFFATDDHLVVTYVNRAAERMLGRPREELVGRSLLDAFPEARGTLFEARYREAIATRTFMNFEVQLDAASLKDWYDVRVYPSAEGVSVFLQVTTERKRAEAQRDLLETQRRQIQKTESLSRMAGAIAHHFNNQLHAMLIGLDMARHDAASAPAAQEALDAVTQSANKAAEVSSLMLTYLGQTHGRRVPQDLSSTCRGVLDALRATLPGGLVLETDLPEPGPTIAANVAQLQQVIKNLMTNAIEAMVGGKGVVRVRVNTIASASLSDRIRFPADWRPRDPVYALLEVSDSGCGIAAEDLDRIFDPFFTRKFTGRGLGLPVVLGFVRAHDGVVVVESEPGRGSHFALWLPLTSQAVPQPAASPLPVSSTPGDDRARALLIIEDDLAVRTLVVASLRKCGLTVFEAADGVEALEVYRAHAKQIGCVLCDLTMPRMNGWETMAALRKLSPRLPIVLSSGYNEAHALDGHNEAQPQAFLSKPYEVGTLLNMIGRFLPLPPQIYLRNPRG